MSDAEATIRHAILDGYSSSSDSGKRIDAIFESIFLSSTKWAIEDYLKEAIGKE